MKSPHTGTFSRDPLRTSVKRGLVILSRVLRVAERVWGISIPKNSIPVVSLPKADKGEIRRLERLTQLGAKETQGK